MNRFVGIYSAGSGRTRDGARQRADLARWALGQGGEVRWYRDKLPGSSQDRPG